MTKFSAPINPERPRGGPSCAKCAHLVTTWPVPELRLATSCAFGRELEPCDQFADASVDRTERRGLKQGYDVVRVNQKSSELVQA